MLSGVFPMLPTPFDARGELDLASIDRLVGRLHGEGVHGISALGLGGEAGLLTMAERLAVAEHVLAASHGRLPVVAGATAQNTDSACLLAEHAAKAGAAAVMLAPPTGESGTGSALVDHYLAVADTISPTPLMVQDAPSFVGTALTAGFVADLRSRAANVTYAKTEAVPVGDAIRALVRSAVDVAVFGGHAGLYAIDAFDAGAVGLIPGCEVAGQLAALFDDHRAGRRDRAVTSHRQLLPLLAFMFQSLDFYLSCSKLLLAESGLLSHPTTRTGPPLTVDSTRTLLQLAATAKAA